MTALRLQSRAEGGRSMYQFRTRDGLHSDDAFRDGDLLALDHCWAVDLGDLLVVEANYGVVGVILADKAASVTMTESSARAADCCRANARENGVSVTVRTVGTPANLDRRFDTAVYVPKPYTPLAVGKQRIADALERLRPGGKLFLAGTDDTGLSRYRECLPDIECGPKSVASGKRTELVRASRPPDVNSPRYVQPRTRKACVAGIELQLATEPGLFAAGGLDHGTRLLLEAADITDGDRVLDLCCGYGAVGTYAARSADCSVVLTDDDARAIGCAERTLSANGVEGTIVAADCLEGVDDQTFDQVLSNPPTHAGSGALADLFDGTHDVLAPDGRLTFVHHRSLDLSQYLTAFDSVRQVADGDEHVVYVAEP